MSNIELYSQDMVEDDVMILDSGDEIYVWIGNDANQDERKESLKLAEVRHGFIKLDLFWRIMQIKPTTSYYLKTLL